MRLEGSYRLPVLFDQFVELVRVDLFVELAEFIDEREHVVPVAG